MKVSKFSHRNSLVALCIVYFVLYSMFLLGCYFAFQTWADRRMEHAFPTMEEFLEYSDRLEQEQYSKIPMETFPGCSYIVFDAYGKTRYASDENIAARIDVSDLSLINAYGSNRSFSVRESKDDAGNLQYIILLTYYNEETDFTEEIGRCILDQNLNALEDDLFGGIDHLTKREFHFLQGRYRSHESIERYSYLDSNGETCSVVFVSPRFTNKAYAQLLRQTNQIWLMVIPLIGLGTVFFVFLFQRRLRRMLAILNSEIRRYQEEQKPDHRDIPIEFETTVETLDHLLDRLDEANRERQRMIAGLSHDLKTPLSVIHGCARAFTEGLVPQEETDKYMYMIFQRSQMVDELINTLFDYAKMEHPNYQPQCELTEFGEYLREFLADKYTEIELAGFSLDIDIPEQPLVRSIDRRLFRRCMENLLSNSLKYNPPGTTLYICLQEHGADAQLTVADDGNGIPPEILSTAFESFVTGNAARTAGKSTGLGLSIAKKIVELHGGSIRLVVSPESPYQTQFCICIPKKGKNS